MHNLPSEASMLRTLLEKEIKEKEAALRERNLYANKAAAAESMLSEAKERLDKTLQIASAGKKLLVDSVLSKFPFLSVDGIPLDDVLKDIFRKIEEINNSE